MAKNKSLRYVCSNCGGESAVWNGKCPQCGEWNTLREQLTPETIKASINGGSMLHAEPVDISASLHIDRLVSGVSEVDDVFGGGIVPGSVNLIAGQPGIGKSTLLLQLAYDVAKLHPVLYVSGEESVNQVAMRAHRLGTTQHELQLVNSTSAEDIAATIASGAYKLIIIDSIQTITIRDISSAAGTVSQITNSTQLLTIAAKQSNTAIILVGHVTKEGTIAGPKVLEHVVDVVLHLEGDRYGGFKVLRTIKNRFGSTNETGIFEMQDIGLKPVLNPSAALLAERQITDGSIVFATIEGSRPLLVEVQALVNKTSYGYPKRAASGLDINRLNLLIAMLERRTKLNLAQSDIYINVVGGIKINEPAADLAVCLAIGSAAKGMQLKQNAVVFGEVGLSGEVRHVPHVEKRIEEAKKMGFDTAIGPIMRAGNKISFLTSVPDVRASLNKFLLS